MQSTRSPVTTPSKRQKSLSEHFFSPQKHASPSKLLNTCSPVREVDGVSLNAAPPSSSAVRKRNIRDQDEGFAQPKEGKMTKFINPIRQSSPPLKHPMTNHHRSNVANTSNKVAKPISHAFLDTASGVPLADIQPDPAPHNSVYAHAAQPEYCGEVGLLDDLTFSDWSLSQSAGLNSQTTCPNASGEPASSPQTALSRTHERSLQRIHMAIMTQSPRSQKVPSHGSWYQYSEPSPLASDLTRSLVNYGLPAKLYRDPFYSDPNDVPLRKREYAGRQYVVSGNTLRFIPEFEHAISRRATALWSVPRSVLRVVRWEFATPPPTLSDLYRDQITQSEYASVSSHSIMI